MKRNTILCAIMALSVFILSSCSGSGPGNTSGSSENDAAGTGQAEKQPGETAAPCAGDMVLIKAGKFMMGCSTDDIECRENEQPRKEVTITKDFCMDKYEVTQKKFEKVMGSNPSEMAVCGDDCPVDSVLWDEAVTYCEKTGGRLPSEAEWEYAARAGTETKYYWGDGLIRENAWYDVNSRVKYDVGIEYIGMGKQKVGLLNPNDFGLYDMLGNIHEWTQDCYVENWVQEMPGEDPVSEGEECEFRVTRGGSWYFGKYALRVSQHEGHPPDYRHVYNGFRCVADAK